ncbi:hypothetical protein Tco_0795665 [Tanacetum coccineum]
MRCMFNPRNIHIGSEIGQGLQVSLVLVEDDRMKQFSFKGVLANSLNFSLFPSKFLVECKFGMSIKASEKELYALRIRSNTGATTGANIGLRIVFYETEFVTTGAYVSMKNKYISIFSTKHYAARYYVDMDRKLWFSDQSPHMVYSDKRIITVTSINVKRKWGYGFLTSIMVKRSDGKEYEFNEADLHNSGLVIDESYRKPTDDAWMNTKLGRGNKNLKGKSGGL